MSPSQAYNLQDPTQVFQAPLVEEAASISGQSTPTTHYEHFRRILNKACQGKDWTWSEVIPDAVVSAIQKSCHQSSSHSLMLKPFF